MDIDEFVEKEFVKMQARADAVFNQWHKDNTIGPVGVPTSIPTWEPKIPEQTGYSVSYWTYMALAKRNPCAVDFIIDTKRGRSRMTLFGFPVEQREGLEDFDATILPAWEGT